MKRGKALASGSSLSQRSHKTAERYQNERVPFVRRILAERPWCEACGVWAHSDGKPIYRLNPSVDVHERLTRGRSGGVHGEAWLDDDNVIATCRPCHERIDHFPALAQVLGLLEPSRY